MRRNFVVASLQPLTECMRCRIESARCLPGNALPHGETLCRTQGGWRQQGYTITRRGKSANAHPPLYPPRHPPPPTRLKQHGAPHAPSGVGLVGFQKGVPRGFRGGSAGVRVGFRGFRGGSGGLRGVPRPCWRFRSKFGRMAVYCHHCGFARKFPGILHFMPT